MVPTPKLADIFRNWEPTSGWSALNLEHIGQKHPNTTYDIYIEHHYLQYYTVILFFLVMQKSSRNTDQVDKSAGQFSILSLK